MNEEPKRWLSSEGNASGETRRVLGAGLDMDPPSGAKAQIWAALATRLPPGGGGHGAGEVGTASASGVTASGFIKMLVVGVAAGAAVSGIALLANDSKTHAPQAVPAATRSAISSPVALPPAAPEQTPDQPPRIENSAPASKPRVLRQNSESGEAQRPPVVESAAAPVASFNPPERPASVSAAERASRLREEAELVRHARQALVSGNAARALSILRQTAQKFPSGELGQEREALTVQALASSGARAEAKARAEKFLRAYPDSPHAAPVRELAK